MTENRKQNEGKIIRKEKIKELMGVRIIDGRTKKRKRKKEKGKEKK